MENDNTQLSDQNPDASSTNNITPDGGGKNASAVALGRLGGLKGGKARAEKLTPEKRAEIAKKAAAARWGNKI